MNTGNENLRWYAKGLKDGFPIGMGYFAVAFALGITAKKIGMTPLQAGAMSALMVASAGQFAAMTVIATGGGYLQMAVTTLIVNLRYLLMSCALSQKLKPETGILHRMAMSYGITDEIFGIAVSVDGRLNPFYNYGAISISVPGWTLGAFLGASVGAILPKSVENALGVALYGMFLAIIIPESRKNKFVAGVVMISMILSCIFAVVPWLSTISSGMRIILLTVVISAAAALIRPVEGEEGDVHGE